jgi:helix-turn-helix protein
MSKINRNRGSKGADRFFKAERYISETFAWKRLSPAARAAWLEFGWTYNGSNNGRLAMPSRQLAEKLNMGRDTAARAIRELVTFGFLEITQAGAFCGTRRTTEYRLTQFNCDKTGELLSRAFQNIGKRP